MNPALLGLVLRDHNWRAITDAGIDVPILDVAALVGEADEAVIRALWNHTEDVYDAMDAVDELLGEATAARSLADNQVKASEDLANTVLTFFDTIQHGGNDPLLLTIVRHERDEILRAIERWKACQ